MQKKLPNQMPEIIFEDDWVLVINKPPGLPSQSESLHHPSVMRWLQEISPSGFSGLIHRLDQNVSGLMIAAKHSKSAQILTKSLKAGKICRLYQAWVKGEIDIKSRITHWIAKNSQQRKAIVKENEFEKSKIAILTIQPIKKSLWGKRPISLAEFNLETGRYHQIRAQCAFIGHPVLGDLKYGGDMKKHGRFSFGRPALHAVELAFPHPKTKKLMTWKSKLPKEFEI